jgi:hypothetical protein
VRSRSPVPHSEVVVVHFTEPPPRGALQQRFLTILPRVEQHARLYFRGLRCPHRRDEAVQETLALAWLWFVRLTARGKDPLEFPATFAGYAVRAVRCGRRVCGQEKAKDALSPPAQRRHGFAVEPLPASTRRPVSERLGAVGGQRTQDALEERLRDNTQTPVPEQVCFRIDFPAWLATLTGRERRLVRAMAQGERTQDLGRRFDLSPARISQLRRELHDDWQRFCEPVPA